MKGPFCVIMISVFFVTTNGQCQMDVGSNAISSCEGSTTYGRYIYVDFYRINRPCTCTVISLFNGDLLVFKKKDLLSQTCNTRINLNVSLNYGCSASSATFSVTINHSLLVKSEYEPPATSGTFHQCLEFTQNGGYNGNMSVICGSSSDRATSTVSSTTISTTTLTLTQVPHASSPTASSIESTFVVNTIENTDVTLSSNTINVSYDSLSMESTKDDPELLYIIVGSAAGGAIILVGLIVLILVLIIRSARNKNESTEADMARTNEVFDSNPELPDNPLYLSSQPMDELGYSSDQEKQLGLPPTDSKAKKKIYSNYDVPPNNKPIDHSAPSMPVYAVPKRGKDCTPNVSTGDVYAEVCKPNRSTAQVPVRKRNEDGLLYMEFEQDTAATKEINTNDNNKITEGVCYTEIRHK